MSIDEARMQLHEEARRALGDVAADVLMNALTADPEALATSSHVTDVGAEVRAEFSKLDTRLAVTEANLRGDFKSSSATPIGRASARHREGQYAMISVVAEPYKNKK